jgi:H+/Cl- antiporter ClcA
VTLEKVYEAAIIATFEQTNLRSFRFPGGNPFGMKSADKAIITSGLIAAASTAGLAAVRGYGTVLFQIVVLWAWSIVASITSGSFADQHHEVVWIVALLLNTLGFAIVGVPLWLISRDRLPKSGPVLIICWTILYLAMLFVLFPATDGP